MKKVILMALSLVLVAALSIAGTLAYLQFQTPTDLNVMVIGNVKIEQVEQERDANGNLIDFTQAKPAYPVVGTIAWDDELLNVNGYECKVFDRDLKNVVDKIVTVNNIGKTDAYVRTIVAIEAPGGDPNDLIHINLNNNGVTTGAAFITKINGVDYYIAEYIYTDVIKAGSKSAPSMMQLFLDSAATNEDCALFGDTWEVLVVSQAVQAAGFGNATAALEAGFGKITATQHPWSNTAPVIPAVVDSANELEEAIADGKDVILTNDVVVNQTISIPQNSDVTINLNGNDLSYAVDNTGASSIINNKGSLELTGSGTISYVAANPDLNAMPAYATNTISNTGVLVINDGVVITNGSQGGASYAVDNFGTLIMNGGKLVGERCALRIARYNSSDVKFVMNGGIVEAQKPAWIQLPGSNSADAPSISVTINGGTFKSTKASSEDNDLLYTYSYGNSHANTNITINGGEFLGGVVSIGAGYKGDVPSLTINGGTFEYDVVQWLENDDVNVLYKANK